VREKGLNRLTAARGYATPSKLLTRRSFIAGGAGVLVSSCVGRPSRHPSSSSPFAGDFELLNSRLAADYFFFDQKQTDWRAVGDLFRPRAHEVRDAKAFNGRSRSDFVPDVIVRMEDTYASEDGVEPVLAAAIAEVEMRARLPSWPRIAPARRPVPLPT
jgi:hypothetical protein